MQVYFGDKIEVETEEGSEFLRLEHIPTLIDALREKIEKAEVLNAEFVQAMLKEIQKSTK